MLRNYIAITYDVCMHNDLYEEMNTYMLDPLSDMDAQVHGLAEADFASLVKVFESPTRDGETVSLYKEYTFSKYECNCDE